MFSKKRKKRTPESKETGFKVEPKITTSTEDFEQLETKELSTPEDKLEYKHFQEKYCKNAFSLLTKLHTEFGWNIERATFFKKTEENMQKAFYILKNKISAPLSDYCYHGTSSSNYDSIKNKGLNNGLIGEVNRGIIAPVSNGTTFITHYDQAFDFAESTATKRGGVPLVIRWPSTSGPLKKGDVGVTQQPIDPTKLEFCLDEEGTTWYRSISEELFSKSAKFSRDS